MSFQSLVKGLDEYFNVVTDVSIRRRVEGSLRSLSDYRLFRRVFLFLVYGQYRLFTNSIRDLCQIFG